VQPVGLDIERAKRDMESPGIASILKQDTADLLSLKVEKTPTFYVNGELLRAVSSDGLRTMVQKEVTANYKQK
jgi:predicted DsbA family dithiol-disulfide isomerase